MPQGLICTARGGSSLALWDPKDPAQLYASMLASVRATGQPVAGVLWYQGESDTSPDSAAAYTENMTALVAAFRRDLRQPRLPWVIVQLGRVFRLGDGAHWNSVQEQQRLLPIRIRDLECVAAIDLSLDDEIHISADSLPLLATRLARATDRLVHGNRNENHPPSLAYIRRTVSREDAPGPKCGIDVGFDGIEGRLHAEGEPAGFMLIDRDGREVPWIFKTTLHDHFVRLHIMRAPPEGTRLAYGVGFGPRCNVTDGRRMALPVFTPQEIMQHGELLPFINLWRTAPLVDAAVSFKNLTIPATFAWSEAKLYESGFVNEHDAWQHKVGYAFFSSSLETVGRQTLDFLMGYDGPFRLWLDGRPIFCDPAGGNPCIADQSGKMVKLAPGKHEIVVAMDVDFGRAWGFFLRGRRIENTAKLARTKPRIKAAESNVSELYALRSERTGRNTQS